MRKKFDNIFSALMLLSAVWVVLAGAYCLSHSIARAKPEPIQVARVHIETAPPEPDPSPGPTLELGRTEYNPSIPLSRELQEVLFEACAENEVPVAIALGVIEIESRFQADAVSSEGCVGLMQLNPRYFPADLSPTDNLREGIGHLSRLLDQYGDTAAALTAYNAGRDTGSRDYANAVLAAAEWWEEALG